jgi:hypothetical protein
MNQHLSAIDIAALHNAFATLTQAYGHMLAEQDRRLQMLSAQLKAANEELNKLRGETGKSF